jgi:uncharacterized membrane protein
MEKKVKRTEGTKTFSDKREEKIIIVTILVALVILGVLLARLVFTPFTPEPFSAIYYLDSEKQTTNLPKTVVLGQNSTFSLWVGVENQNDTTIDYLVNLKIDDGKGPINPSPVEVTENFEKTLADEDLWEFQVTVDIEQLGNNRVIFELWYLNQTTQKFDYTGNWVNLSVEAVS